MKIITWNIQWGRGADGRVDLERVARAARETADFDVLCLQEVAVNFPGLAGGGGEDDVALLREAFPGYEAVYGPAIDVPDGKGGRSLFGNLILSRLPVGQVFRHLLPWPADAAVPSMQRLALEAVIDAARGPLRIVTTHLEYYSRRQRLVAAEALRVMHAEACAHASAPRGGEAQGAIFAVQPRPAPAVFCGDFNFEPRDAEHGVMTAPFAAGVPALRDAWQIAHGNEPHAHTVGLHGAEWPDRPYCCDFFFVSEDLAAAVAAVEVNQATDASDHQPVLLELVGKT